MGHWWDQEINQEVSGNKWKWIQNNPKPMGYSENSPESEVCSIISLPQKDRKISNKWSNPTLKKTRKTTTKA